MPAGKGVTANAEVAEAVQLFTRKHTTMFVGLAGLLALFGWPAFPCCNSGTVAVVWATFILKITVAGTAQVLHLFPF